jgi:hypothetical protein
MAGNTYVVRLVDCLQGVGGVDKDGPAVLGLMKVWYAAVCQEASGKGDGWTADVAWMDQPVTANASQDAGSGLVFNLMLFYVPTPRDSVIKLHPSLRAAPLPHDDPMAWGTTARATKGGRTTVCISEIYSARCRAGGGDPALNLARMGVHEGMHNQLGQDTAMHKGALGFKAETPVGTSPTKENLQEMARRLTVLVPQWVDGLQAWRLNRMDPLGI